MLKRFIWAAIFLFAITNTIAFGDEAEPKSNMEIPIIQLQNDEEIILDGNLDEAVYEKHKPQLLMVKFYHESTGEKIPEGNETTIWLMHNEEGIYFAVILNYGRPEEMVMGKSRSTTPWTSWLQTIGEDYIALYIDLENSRQSSDQSFVMVNPSNAKWVSISSGKTERLLEEVKSGVVVAGGKVSVEVFLPFSLLIYQGEGERTVAINFEMKRQYLDDASYRWRHAGPNNDPAKMGATTLFLPKLKRNTDFFIDASYIKEEDAELRAGVNFRQDLTAELKAAGAINPDFKDVKENVESIDFARQEIYRTEKRPFLAEGGKLVGMGNDFYSRRIKDVEIGLNSHGEIGPVRFGALGIFNREEERDFILKSSLNTMGAQNSLGYISSQKARGEPADQFARYSLNKNWGVVDLNTNWAAFYGKGQEPAYRGYTSLSFVPLGGRVGISHYFTEKGLSGNRFGFYGNSPDTRGVSTYALFEKVWEKTERGLGRHLRKISTYHYAALSNFMNGAVYDRFMMFRYWIQHQKDWGARCILTLERYGEYDDGRYNRDDDWQIDLEPQKLFSPKDKKFKYTFGLNYKSGRQKEKVKHFLKPFCGVELKTGVESRFKANISYEVLRHIEHREQFVLEVNYEFSTLTGVGCRLFYNGKDWVPYIAAWLKQDEAGIQPSIYLTFGEPNPYAEELKKYQFALKSEFRFNISY